MDAKAFGQQVMQVTFGVGGCGWVAGLGSPKARHVGGAGPQGNAPGLGQPRPRTSHTPCFLKPGVSDALGTPGTLLADISPRPRLPASSHLGLNLNENPWEDRSFSLPGSPRGCFSTREREGERERERGREQSMDACGALILKRCRRILA